MRTVFIKTLTELAEKDKNLYLLTGDLGFSLFEDFANKFPRQFINCGVAEQNMAGVAAGLALSRKKVYLYSIAPFVTMRCFEQIRNDICYQNLDVKIVGIGGGFSYGSQGATHHALEDMAILRALPNMTVLCPADPTEARELILESYKTKNPTYLRLDRKGDKELYNFRPNIIIGKPSILKEGKDGVIITSGTYLEVAINIVKKLEQKGFNFKLISMHTLKPIDTLSLLKEIKEKKFIFTLEEHNVIGGLGSAIAEIVLASSSNNITFKSFGFDEKYAEIVGEQDYLRRYYKIDEESIYHQIINQMQSYGK